LCFAGATYTGRHMARASVVSDFPSVSEVAGGTGYSACQDVCVFWGAGYFSFSVCVVGSIVSLRLLPALSGLLPPYMCVLGGVVEKGAPAWGLLVRLLRQLPRLLPGDFLPPRSCIIFKPNSG